MTTVLTSSLATLLALLLGLGAAVLVVGSLLGRSVPDARRWTLAAVVITVVGLGATLPAKLRDTVNALDSQRKGYAGTDERTAREKCLNDMNRPDLVDALAFARARMSDDARFWVTTNSRSAACVMINLFPREPVRQSDFDPARTWAVFDGTAPKEVARQALSQRALPESERRYLLHSPSFILVRPGGELAR